MALEIDIKPLQVGFHNMNKTLVGWYQDLSAQQQMVTDLLQQARSQGASAAEAGVSISSGLAVNVRIGEVESIEHTRDHSLGVTVFFGHRKGSASTTDFSATAIEDTVAAACHIARHTSEDRYAGLADADRMATAIPNLDLHHPWDLDAEQAIALAMRTEQAGRDHDKRITNSDGASVSRHEGGYVYGNSHGFIGSYASTRHDCSCTLIAEDDSGMQRDYFYSCNRNAAHLESPEAIGRKAAERTVMRLGARQVATCKTPVIYQAEVARGLVRHLVSAVSGAALYRKASFLLDQIGNPVMFGRARLYEQPHLPGALGSAPFDQEGVATNASDLVMDGVLQRYVLDSYAARRLGLATTANAGGVHNLTLCSDDLSFQQLLQQMGNGLLITELMGMGINTVTGDYSRGATGYWILNGEIAYPVEEITVAGNLKEMYQAIQAVSADVDIRGNIRTGSMLIDAMTVAGR